MLPPDKNQPQPQRQAPGSEPAKGTDIADVVRKVPEKPDTTLPGQGVGNIFGISSSGSSGSSSSSGKSSSGSSNKKRSIDRDIDTHRDRRGSFDRVESADNLRQLEEAQSLLAQATSSAPAPAPAPGPLREDRSYYSDDAFIGGKKSRKKKKISQGRNSSQNYKITQ